MKSLVIFYIDVGQLSPEKAEDYVNRLQEKYKEQIEKMKQSGTEPIWLPIRGDSQTRVEVIPVGGESLDKVFASN